MYITLANWGAGRNETATELKYFSGILVVYVICAFTDRNASCKVLFSLLPPHTVMFFCAISTKYLKYPLFPSARRKYVIYHLQDSAGQMACINLYLSNSSQERETNWREIALVVPPPALEFARTVFPTLPRALAAFAPRVWCGHGSPPSR